DRVDLARRFALDAEALHEARREPCLVEENEPALTPSRLGRAGRRRRLLPDRREEPVGHVAPLLEPSLTRGAGERIARLEEMALPLKGVRRQRNAPQVLALVEGAPVDVASGRPETREGGEEDLVLGARFLRVARGRDH